MKEKILEKIFLMKPRVRSTAWCTGTPLQGPISFQYRALQYNIVQWQEIFRFLVSDYYNKLKGEKIRPRTVDLIVADGETTDSALSQSGGDQSETSMTETRSSAPGPLAREMTVAGPECVLRPVSCHTQKAIVELQTHTLDYETEKLLMFSK